MAFAQEIFFEVFIIILCFNSGFLLVGYLSGQTIVSPFNTSFNINGINNTSIYPTNSQGGIIANVTTNVHNSTSGGGSLLNQISSNTFFVLSILWLFFQFVSGGFVFSVLGILGFPQIFVYIIQAVLMVFGARSAVYYFTGR